MNIEKQKATLLSQIESLTYRINDNQDMISQQRDGVSEDDIASQYEMQAKAHSTIQIDKKQLIKARKALARIESGDYEYCEACGVQINPKRLEANPTAKLCIDCANHADHVNRLFA